MIARSETRYAAGRVLFALLRPYWRWRRAATLGAQGIVVDQDGRVLLLRHTYKPGWWFPGGGVERGESCEQAVARELQEEALVMPIERPVLHGLFTNFANFPADHIAVFVVRDWRHVGGATCAQEIEAVEWFPLDALPPDISRGTRRRLAEVFEGAERSEVW